MRNRFKYLMLLPLTTIVSCGYSTSYLVEGNKYTSSVFKENYYTHWDKELKTAHKNPIVDVTDETIVSGVSYSFFGSNTINGLSEIDPNFFEKDPGLEEYSGEYKMNSVDDIFNYGYQSKLFDGQMVCGGQNGHPEYAYQLGRVQINQSGFSIRFSKESNELHYFAMNFKATTDNTIKCDPVPNTTDPHSSIDVQLYHESTFTLLVTLYLKTNNGIEGYPFSIDVSLTGKVNNSYKTNNGSYYNFLAFDLQKYKTETFSFTRLVGVSVEYEVTSDTLIEYNAGRGVDISYDDYALFLYEMFFPYTSWN